MRAAVENGADAVYFGLAGGFNARARAANFEDRELGEVMAYLRERGVKGFVALNVLVFDEELAEVEARVRLIAAAGADAVIVQDLAVVGLARRVAPGLPVHGSTQMSVTSADGAEFARAAGAERIVVGRELSVTEISQVRGGTSAEIEAFVHGALCVSYSGQCFSSEAWGGRSANRGQCAQACRLPYGLVVDGQLRDLGDIKYLLSPQDLLAVEQVPALLRAGVACLKIEGRLKGPEYVALTTRVYRDAVDAAGPAAAAPDQAPVLSNQRLAELQQVFARGQDAEHSGLTPGFLEGPRHQRLVRGRAPRHRGVFAGWVTRTAGRRIWVGLAATLKRGDGVVFDAGAPGEAEQGGGTACASAREVQLMFGPGCVDATRVAPGSLVWRSSDPALEARLRSTYEGLAAAAARRLPVDVAVAGRIGQALTVEVRGDNGCAACGESAALLAGADRRPLDAAAVAGAVGGLGGSTLSLRCLDLSALDLGAGLFIPLGEIKAARRAAVARFCASLQRHAAAEGLAREPVLPALLAAVRGDPDPNPSPPGGSKTPDMGFAWKPALPALLAAAQGGPAGGIHTLDNTRQEPASGKAPGLGSDAGDSAAEGAAVGIHPVEGAGRGAPAEYAAGGSAGGSTAAGRGAAPRAGPGSEGGAPPRAVRDQPLLRVLCRSKAQADAACKLPWLSEIVLDFLEVHGLREAVAAARVAGKRVVAACPRVLKPGEDSLARFYLRLGADALLVRSAGLLYRLSRARGAGAEMESNGTHMPDLEGDFSLNAANAVAAGALLGAGLSRLAPTHDLSGVQLVGLARSLGRRATMLEAIVHHHLPIFHTEHCVFARFLSDGNDFHDCGRPCERASVHLRDAAGADHLVLADEGCRNTVFNAAAQSGLWHLADLRAAGYGAFRVELAAETGGDVAPLLEAYRAMLANPNSSTGGMSPGAAWHWLASRPGGVTSGNMLKGRVALITGSTQGIGLGMLRGLAQAGADVVMHGLAKPEELQAKVTAVEDEFGVKVGHSDANVMKPAEIREMIRSVQRDFGRLDILVNNVGIQHVAPVHEFPDDKWDAIIAVCLSSAFHTTKAALPAMLASGWGRIINTGSMHALVASPYKSAYNAAKHGIAGLTKTVALETAREEQVTCNAICPGYVLTDLVRNQLEDTSRARGIPVDKVISDVLLADQPTKRFVRVEEIAALVRHLCSDDAASITGACLSIDGGWTAR
ncbi:hypothetical protein WJX81_006317 [Elliptochloris bilobata]|uniref:Peptidase U32 collagenase domain-containing protein n=1 Tax=Elliptochloris bilobata TaxID=381761 RepID=A0AAW1QWM4_9CHLO